MVNREKMNRVLLLNQTLEALALVLEFNMRDHPSHQHALRTGEGCALMAEKMGLAAPNIQKIYFAGLLHDIGKISIDQRLLSKKGKLTDDEFDTLKKHTVNGSRIIASLPGMGELALWVRWHHEWWDGSGYPDGLAGTEIPVEVQILGVVDCFDSLQTPRLDRDGFSQEEALKIIKKERGRHFNPDIFDHVMEMVQAKALLTSHSSSAFLDLKRKFIDVPFPELGESFWTGSSMVEMTPIIQLFARVIDAKHKYTRGHSTRVAQLAKLMAERINLPPDDVLKTEVSGLLHDAGKVSVPVEILDKPGRPSNDEWDIIRSHPKKSFDILSHIPSLEDVALISSRHHEKFDGTGYPSSIAGDKIHKISLIIAVADTYDAITSTRAYREGSPPEVAYDIIKNQLGKQFDPEVGNILLNIPPKHIQALFDTYEVMNI